MNKKRFYEPGNSFLILLLSLSFLGTYLQRPSRLENFWNFKKRIVLMVTLKFHAQSRDVLLSFHPWFHPFWLLSEYCDRMTQREQRILKGTKRNHRGFKTSLKLNLGKSQNYLNIPCLSLHNNSKRVICNDSIQGSSNS